MEENKVLEQLLASFTEVQKNLVESLKNGQDNILNDRKHIKVVNLMPFSVGLGRTNMHPMGVLCKGDSANSDMTLDEIKQFVDCGNTGIIGIDGKGTHAPIRICDFEMYKMAFNCPEAKDYPLQLTYDEIEKLLKITNEKKFCNRLKELVYTESEKKAFAYIVWSKELTKNLFSWQVKAMEDHTGYEIE